MWPYWLNRNTRAVREASHCPQKDTQSLEMCVVVLSVRSLYLQAAVLAALLQSYLGCVCERCLSGCDCVVCNLAFSLPQWFSTGPATGSTFVSSLSSAITEYVNHSDWFRCSSVILMLMHCQGFVVVAFTCFTEGFFNSFCKGPFSEDEETCDHAGLLLGTLSWQPHVAATNCTFKSSSGKSGHHRINHGPQACCLCIHGGYMHGSWGTSWELYLDTISHQIEKTK